MKVIKLIKEKLEKDGIKLSKKTIAIIYKEGFLRGRNVGILKAKGIYQATNQMLDEIILTQ